MQVTKELINNRLAFINGDLEKHGKDFRLGVDYAYGGCRITVSKVDNPHGVEQDLGNRTTKREIHERLYCIDGFLTQFAK